MIISEAPIGSVAEVIIDYRGKTPPKSGSGIPLLTAKVIKDGTIDRSRLEYISEETYAWWMRRGYPKQRDILVTTEAPLGESAILRIDERVALAQRVILLRGNPSIIDQYYFFVAIRSPLIQSRLRERATGTTVLGIKQRELRHVLIPVPPLAIQRKIAAILSAYDDLIESNRRRIQILEEMAQRIYRERFVDLRYPGHDGVPVVESELGPIPEGWEVTTIGQRFEVVLGGTPSRSRPEYWTGGSVPWINSGKVNELRVLEPSEMITEDGLRASNAQLMPRHTTLVAITGATLGQVSYLEIEASANQSVVGIFDPSDQYSELIYLEVRNRIAAIVAHAGGSAQQHINKRVVDATLILVPASELLMAFRNVVRPIFDQITSLMRSSVLLRVTRDHLLTRLMSGELDIEDLDIAVEDPAA